MSTGGLIVVAGEALFDLVADDTGRLHAHPGGGPFNAARTIGRLEQPVAFLGRLSTDRFGARLRFELESDGVRLDTVVTTDEPTTLALAELAADGSAVYRFYADGTSAAGRNSLRCTSSRARARLRRKRGLRCLAALSLQGGPDGPTYSGTTPVSPMKVGSAR